MEKEFKVFVAYPAVPQEIGSTIQAATERLHRYQTRTRFRTWHQTDVAGAFIGDRILEEIRLSDALVADITNLNFNVTYEVGYAIGLGKSIKLVRNKLFRSDPIPLEALGIYDTIGYDSYENTEQLSEKLRTIVNVDPIAAARSPNARAPVYLNQSKARTDHQDEILSRVMKANLHFRSFDPNETPRLSAREAIQQVAQSLGVLVHFVPDEYDGSAQHNLRAAFIAGLAHGMERETLLIQYGDSPVPMDYRDFVTYCRAPEDYKDHIGRFASRVIEAMQAGAPIATARKASFLASLDLGASIAENELTSLDEYYLETHAFRRAQRGEARLITGRKGSGKTAIFLRLRDKIRTSKANVVLDLKPEGYQLRKFKDSVMLRLEGGSGEHVLIAFWEYVLLLEIVRSLVTTDHSVYKFDHRLFEPYQRLLAVLHRTYSTEEGDFAERLATLLHNLEETFLAKHGDSSDVRLLQPEVTALIYRHDIHELRKHVFAYLEYKEELWLLFDNLDKGWPTSGLTSDDLTIIRTLLEATRKLEREATKHGITAHAIVFLRNDVYELLLDTTPDRGKEARINVDWTDRELLEEMLRKRIIKNEPSWQEAEFKKVWQSICQPLVDGEDSAEYVLDRSLMRPRSLLNLIGHCLGVAASLRHDKITEEDVLKGFGAYSTDLVTEISLEIRDVFPRGEDVLYSFIGAKEEVSVLELESMLESMNVTREEFARVRSVLFWFAFLGVQWPGEKFKYIYDTNYDMKVFLGAHDKFSASGQLRYQVNPAFWPGLGIGPFR